MQTTHTMAFLCLLVASSLLSLPACTRAPAGSSCSDDAAATLPDGEVALARVNGRTLTRGDVMHQYGQRRHGEELTPERERNLLEGIIEDELAYQRALELGLDSDPEYREKRHRLQIQFDALARQELAEVFRRVEIEAKAEVGEDEARLYFAEHEEHIRTETRVWQILSKSRPEIDGYRVRLDAGESFETLAAEPMATHGVAGLRSWDLGYLRWTQIPEPWHPELARLEVGQTSDVIEGPGGRFWIIRVVDRRISDDLTFEEVQPILVQQLQRERSESLTEQTRQDLRERANIEYLQP